MARLVTKFGFIKPKTKKNRGNYAKYIATREGAVPIKAEKTYADYIATRPRAERLGTHGLFSDAGISVNLNEVSSDINALEGNLWTLIISLRREDAERLGYNNAERWREMLRTQTQVLADGLHIPLQNLKWYAAFHDEGHHPHVHLIAYSTDPKTGFLSDDGVEKIRSSLAKDIFAQELISIYDQQTEYRNALREKGRGYVAETVRQMQDGFTSSLTQKLLALSVILAHSTGKLQYKFLKPEVKKLVDEIVNDLAAEPEIADLYALWYEQQSAIYEIYSSNPKPKVPLSDNKAFYPIKNAVIQEALKIWDTATSRSDTPAVSDEMDFVFPAPLACGDSSSPYDSERTTLDSDPDLQIYVARSIVHLSSGLAKMIQGNIQAHENDTLAVDRKLWAKIQEKKQAQGLKY